MRDGTTAQDNPGMELSESGMRTPADADIVFVRYSPEFEIVGSYPAFAAL